MTTINKKQKLMIEYAIADVQVFSKVIRVMQPSYFEKPLDRVCEFLLKYYKKHKGIPTTKVIEAETSVELEEFDIDPDQVSYVLDELEEFCQSAAMTNAIYESVDLVNEGKLNAVSDVVRKALMVKIDDSVGISLFDNAAERVRNTDEDSGVTSIGIPALDSLLNRVRRREVGIFYGGTGTGKSIMLANMGHRMSKKNLHGIIISLELKDALYAKRCDCIFTGADISNHAESADVIEEFYNNKKANMGHVVIKFLRNGSTDVDIRTVLMEYELKYKRKPDYICVDYLALMGIEGVNAVGMNKFDLDDMKVFALQAIADEYNAYLFTAGQLNREGGDVIELSAKHVAGGISAVNGSDWSVGMVATDQDMDNNQFQVKQLKIRNGSRTKKPIILYKCPKTLRISDQPFAGQTIIQTKQKEKSDTITIDSAKGKDKLASALRLNKRPK
ncbi:DNA primase/helicase [Alishewanella phage vB_AspM_Slickus01]|nr:DNA primase/helicase [Alishewanella phage vB_AspM_Slickus01]